MPTPGEEATRERPQAWAELLRRNQGRLPGKGGMGGRELSQCLEATLNNNNDINNDNNSWQHLSSVCNVPQSLREAQGRNPFNPSATMVDTLTIIMTPPPRGLRTLRHGLGFLPSNCLCCGWENGHTVSRSREMCALPVVAEGAGGN